MRNIFCRVRSTLCFARRWDMHFWCRSLNVNQSYWYLFGKCLSGTYFFKTLWKLTPILYSQYIRIETKIEMKTDKWRHRHIPDMVTVRLGFRDAAGEVECVTCRQTCVVFARSQQLLLAMPVIRQRLVRLAVRQQFPRRALATYVIRFTMKQQFALMHPYNGNSFDTIKTWAQPHIFHGRDNWFSPRSL